MHELGPLIRVSPKWAGEIGGKKRLPYDRARAQTLDVIARIHNPWIVMGANLSLVLPESKVNRRTWDVLRVESNGQSAKATLCGHWNFSAVEQLACRSVSEETTT